MDQAIDLATAFLDRGLDGLRDAIRKPNERQDMAEKQYDNSNQLGLWKVSEPGRSGYYNGYGEVGGDKVFDAYLIVNRKKENGKGAFATLIWRTDKGWAVPVDIWNNDGKLGGSTEDLWVNVFKNEVAEGSNRPALTVRFKDKEPVGAAASASQPDVFDDSTIPF